MTTATKHANTNCDAGSECGQTMPFANISEPGCYVCNWSGHLMRIPDDAVRQGRSPLIEIIGPETMIVTKLSDDPFIPLTKARMLVADFDHSVNF